MFSAEGMKGKEEMGERGAGRKEGDTERQLHRTE